MKKWQKRMIKIAILIEAAWLLGQIAVPFVMKAIFL